jgi:hypothetical protein
MLQPIAINQFALEQHRGAYETWPVRSRLIADGLTHDVTIPGYQLLHQFEIPDGYLLVTDFDCPYEEATNFVFLSPALQVLAKRSVGVMYSSFLLDSLEWTGARELKATFFQECHWRISISPPALSLMPWRISAKPMQQTI